MTLNYLQVMIFFLSLLMLETTWVQVAGSISFSDMYFEVLGDILWTSCTLTEKSEGEQLCNLVLSKYCMECITC